ncbi:MAG: PLDc_N domain-containing protein [Deltaproteobacteria bacterium]|nr:PLDc_N domain-containing protein [Deltaproteobacteria bacterium]
MGTYEIGVFIYVVLWIVALIDIIRSKFKKNLYELIWLCVIFLVPGIGVPAYFFFAPRHKLEKK